MRLSPITAGLLSPVLVSSHPSDQTPLGDAENNNNEAGNNHIIPLSLFSDLERCSRLVDITYCVGTTGLSQPFSCVSRCKEFHDLQLETTWDTGALMTDNCGYIAVDHGRRHRERVGGGPAILVAFRGTYSLTNTIVDLATIPQEYIPYPSPGDHDGDGDGDGGGDGGDGDSVQCNNCTVHMGFWKSWNSARTEVVPRLSALRDKHPGYTIHLLGHSLGGAVAALAALELKVSLRWENVVVTTFGEPRVGNQKLAQFIDEVFGLETGMSSNSGGGTEQRHPEIWPYRRVTHMNDPVPLLPMSDWGFRSHAGEIFIGKSDLPPDPEDVKACSGDSDRTCSDSADESLRFLMAPGKAEQARELDASGGGKTVSPNSLPLKFKLWQLFFAHRDYFWRLGLCVPGGDPADWGRTRRGHEYEEL